MFWAAQYGGPSWEGGLFCRIEGKLLVDLSLLKLGILSNLESLLDSPRLQNSFVGQLRKRHMARGANARVSGLEQKFNLPDVTSMGAFAAPVSQSSQ